MCPILNGMGRIVPGGAFSWPMSRARGQPHDMTGNVQRDWGIGAFHSDSENHFACQLIAIY